MTYAISFLAGPLARLRVRRADAGEKQVRAIGVARARARLRGKRSNPALPDVGDGRSIVARLYAVWRKRGATRRWQRELAALDDRQLRDIGVTRGDVERLRFWI